MYMFHRSGQAKIWKVVVVGAAALAVAFLGYVGYIVIRGKQNPAAFTPAPSSTVSAVVPNPSAPLVRPENPTLGPVDAKVTIVEFADFQCPFCHDSYPVIRSLMVRYGDRVRFVYRHFPVSSIHEYAQSAAEASVCAAAQGKFWPYHDRLFQNQSQLDATNLERYAAQVGLDFDLFRTCLVAPTTRQIVAQDLADGQALGVAGTPTWFINGEKIEGSIPEDLFAGVIDKLLSQ